MFYIDTSIMVCVAELLSLFCIDELCIYNSILSFSPFKKLKVFLILCLIMKVNLVLLDFLIGKVVSKEIGETMLWAVIATWRRNEMPILSFEGGRLIRFWLFITHLIINFIVQVITLLMCIGLFRKYKLKRMYNWLS